MFKIKSFIIFLLLIGLLPTILPATDTVAYPQVYHAESQITEITLPNGIKVCLKPTSYDQEEVFIQAVSPGGFTLMKTEDWRSAELAPAIAMESEMGPWSPSERAAFAFKHSIDFFPNVDPFSKSIQGSCPTTEIEAFFTLVLHFFADFHFQPEALQTVIKQNQFSLLHRDQDLEALLDHTFISQSTSHHEALRPISSKDLTALNLKAAEQFFTHYFAPSSGWTFIIVGDFQIETITPLLKRYLAKIPVRESSPQKVNFPLSSTFPTVSVTKWIPAPERTDCLTRLAFPLSLTATENSLIEIEFATQIIETRLRSVLKSRFQSTQAIDIAYEFPFYPLRQNAWIALQFRSDKNQREAVKEAILQQLRDLQAHGPTQQEIDTVKTLLTQNCEYWQSENTYWLAELSHLYLWQWDLDNMLSRSQKVRDLKTESIREFLQKNLSLQVQSEVILRNSREIDFGL